MPNENTNHFVRQSLVHATYSHFYKPSWWFLAPGKLTSSLVQINHDDIVPQDKSKRTTIGRYFDLKPLTSVEADLLLECEKKSFFTRSLPMATGTTILLNLGFRSGFLQRRYVVIKYLLGFIVAYAGGKLSYATKCRQMIEDKLPHSALAESLRTQRPLQDIVRERESNNSGWI